jgi:hypothetical protein
MQDDLQSSAGQVSLPALEQPGTLREGFAAVRREWLTDGPLTRAVGRAGLGLIFAVVVLSVLYAAAGSAVFTMHPGNPARPWATLFPGWESGPLAGILSRPLPPHATMVHYQLWSMVVVMLMYLVAVAAARSLGLREVWLFVLGTGAVLLLGPPGPLNDVFNYLGYARLGVVHHMNPYTHVLGQARADPSFPFNSWRNLSSPYGPLFTALSYPLALLPLPVAYWVLKVATVLLSFGLLYCVQRCAQLLGRDARRAILFVAANPLYLFWEVAGFHNDFVMLVPSMAAVGLVLARRERAAGAAIAIAIAVKFTTVVLLPFLLIAAWRDGGRWRRVLLGALIAAVPLAVMDLALFGLSLPNVSDQSSLVTGFSVPNLVGIALGFGGATHTVLRLCELVVGLVVLVSLRRRDWIEGAAWAQLAFIVGLSWLMPWYLVWALPLAALAHGRAVRRASILFTLFVLATFLPTTSQFITRHGVNPTATRYWKVQNRYEQHLQWQHLRYDGPILTAPVRVQAETVRSGTILPACSGCTRSEAPTAWSATRPGRSSAPPTS